MIAKVPADRIGVTMGYLNSKYALLEDLKWTEDICTLQAQIPVKEVQSFTKWFEELTGGKGEVIID